LSRKRSWSSSAARTRRSTRARDSRAPSRPTSTSTFSPPASCSARMPRRTRSYVGSRSSAAHRSASSSSSSSSWNRDDCRENTSSPRRHSELSRRRLVTRWISRSIPDSAAFLPARLWLVAGQWQGFRLCLARALPLSLYMY
ncbi:hypothetical protein ACJX0J_035142, partial [Zea mays]